jgi:hypothetical protein
VNNMGKIGGIRDFLRETSKLEKKSIEAMLTGADNVQKTSNIVNYAQVVLTQPESEEMMRSYVEDFAENRKRKIKDSILNILSVNDISTEDEQKWVEKFCILNNIDTSNMAYQDQVLTADKFIQEHPESVNMLLYMLEQAYISAKVK